MAFELTPLRSLLIGQYGTRSDAIDQTMRLEREVKRAVFAELRLPLIKALDSKVDSCGWVDEKDLIPAIDAAEAEFCGEDVK